MHWEYGVNSDFMSCYKPRDEIKPNGYQSTVTCTITMVTKMLRSRVRVMVSVRGKTTIWVLHDVQLMLNKQQQIWGGVYIH